jgi:DNA adenine methylase
MATLTPFRWPGAKNKMLPILMEHIDKMMVGQNHFVDCFVGGASVLLAVAKKYPDIQLHVNDKDRWVSSFWSVIANDDTEKLDQLLELVDVRPTIEQFYRLRETPPNGEIEEAHYGLFFNRTTFSGILSSGPIGGKEQKSKWAVDCRYNATKLKEKIKTCHQLLVGRTTVECKDFSEYEVLTKSDYPIYCDPPYHEKGAMLYSENMIPNEHIALAGILTKRNNWLLSYDDCPEIRQLYGKHQIIDLAARYSINGKKTNWASKNELIILPGV